MASWTVPGRRSRRCRLGPWVLGATVVVLTALLPPASAQGDTVVQQILARYPGQSHTYDQVVALAQQLDRSPRATCLSIGKSREGRVIPLIALHAPETTYGNTYVLYAIARQHGSEAAGTEALLAIAQHFVNTNGEAELNLLRRCTLVFVPMANPDGAVRNGRDNAGGTDLNRDWINVAQPETKAIEASLRTWRPSAFLDLHELPSSSGRALYQENFVETIGSSSGCPKEMTAQTEWLGGEIARLERAYGADLRVVYDGPAASQQLAHRRLGLYHHIPSFLLETKTGPSRSVQSRMQFHVIATLTVANFLAQRAPSAPSGPVQVSLAPPAPVAPVRPPTRAGGLRTAAAHTAVRLLNPLDSDTVTGDLLVQASVAESVDFAFAGLYLDGVRRELANEPPYEWVVPADDLPNGLHQVTVAAFDGGGAVLAQAAARVEVDRPTADE